MGHHCQICEREIKDSKGIIAHHGYQRPGGGWQTASCMGARNLPYEKSRDLIPKAIHSIDIYIQGRNRELVTVKEGKVPVPSLLKKDPLIYPGAPFYEIRQREHIARVEWEIKCANRDRERLQKRYDDWIEVI